MKNWIMVAVLWALAPAASQALTLPQHALDRWYFVGTSAELFAIREAMEKVAGFPAGSWTQPYSSNSHLIPPPWNMGAVDCMDAFYAPNQGPYDGAEDYLGMSVSIHGGIVEIPALEDLVQASDPAFPGECYGFLFAKTCACGDPVWDEIICPDPVP